MRQLSGKVVAVTGAGSGIGKALAYRLVKEGSTVALIDINQAYLQEVFKEIQAKGGTASVHVSDIASRDSVQKMAHEVIRLHGRVDVLINNAGVSLARIPAHEISWEQWEWMMDVNFWGTLHCTKIFYPFLLKRPEAHIVNVSSVFSLSGVADRGAYCAAKFAVRGLTESMIQEARNTPVRITSVIPGGVSSNITQHCEGVESQQMKAILVKRHEQKSSTSTGQAAEAIIRGIKRNKKRVLIGKDAYLMDFMVRYFRRYVDWLLHRLIIKPERNAIKEAMETK